MYPPLIYVAGAYKGNIAKNITKAEKVSINLIRNGWHVFTPHKNTSHYEQYEDDQLTTKTWIDMDLNMLIRCDAIYIMDNWQDSVGTKIEIEFAIDHTIPRFYEKYDPSETFKLNNTYL